MNLFNFELNEAIKGLMLSVSYGLFFGFIMGLVRYLVISVFERREGR